MAKLKRKRFKTGKYKDTTCHYCDEFYHSRIRQTTGEFVTRDSGGKKVNVRGTTIFRFCTRMRCFTSVNDPICNKENFHLAPMFYCIKRSCWLATNITCYASRARRVAECIRCNQFDNVISQITEKPAEDFSTRRSALTPQFDTQRSPIRYGSPLEITQSSDDITETSNPGLPEHTVINPGRPKRKIRRRRQSEPITQTIDRSTKKKLKRRRKT